MVGRLFCPKSAAAVYNLPYVEGNIMVRADLRVGFVAGALAAVPLVGLLSLASQLSGVSFLPFNLADLLIEATPGQLATNAIETLGGVAKLMAQIGGIVAFVGLAWQCVRPVAALSAPPIMDDCRFRVGLANLFASRVAARVLGDAHVAQ